MSPRARVEDRREALLAAALDVFLRHGYNGTKVADIVDAAGVAQGTFYLYFRSKGDVFRTLVERFLVHLLTVVEASGHVDAPTSAEYARQLRALIAAVLRLCVEHRQLARLFFQEAMAADPSFRDLLMGFYARVVSITRRNLAICAKRGWLRPLDLDVAADACVGMCDMVIQRQLILDERPVDVDRLADELIALQLRGVLRFGGFDDVHQTKKVISSHNE